MGSNFNGQLGLKRSKYSSTSQPNADNNQDFPEPELIEDLKFNKVVKVRAGQFSAALTSEQ